VRFVHLYLLIYALLVIGAGLLLWQAGVSRHLPPSVLLSTAAVVIGLGVALALTTPRT
jgi:hypothetical protein